MEANQTPRVFVRAEVPQIALVVVTEVQNRAGLRASIQVDSILEEFQWFHEAQITNLFLGLGNKCRVGCRADALSARARFLPRAADVTIDR